MAAGARASVATMARAAAAVVARASTAVGAWAAAVAVAPGEAGTGLGLGSTRGREGRHADETASKGGAEERPRLPGLGSWQQWVMARAAWGRK